MSESVPTAPPARGGHPVDKEYVLWKRYGPHVNEYACEFVGTAWLMFAIVAVVSLMSSAVSPVPGVLPSVALRLFCAGALIGASGSLFTISPMGRLSGAHLNPAMSVGFACLGKMHGRDLAGYVLAQFAGALCGSVVAKLALGRAATMIDQAALTQPSHVTLAVCLAGECAATFAYCYIIYNLVSHTRLMRWTPLLNVPLAATIVCLDGNISGAGFNPARWFGPAAVTHTWPLWWVYLIGPLAAAVLAALARRAAPLAPHLVPATAKLFHDERYRSIFKHDQAATTVPQASGDVSSGAAK